MLSKCPESYQIEIFHSGIISRFEQEIRLARNVGRAPAIGKPQKDPTHTANFGVKLQERCGEVGVACEVVYPGAPDARYQTPTDYLISTLNSDRVQ